MNNIDLAIREEHHIPDEADAKEWCEQNGYDYFTELMGAYISLGYPLEGFMEILKMSKIKEE